MMSFADFGDVPLEPVPGAQAFRDETPAAEASRAGQLLAMSTYAFGTDSAVAGIRDDADELEAPQLWSVDEFDEDRWDQGRLDEYTDRVLEGYGERFDGRNGDLNVAAEIMDGFAAGSHPSALLALLNLRQRSDSPVESAAAAAGLRAYSGGSFDVSNEILLQHAFSEDELARGIALASFGAAPLPPVQEAEAPGSNGPALPGQVSTTVHGTWALVSDQDAWYKPGSGMHGLLRDRVSANLYDERGYFFWSGGYSDLDRDQGAQDLARWREDVSPGDNELDIVYAHSHGGNVALSAAAAGQQMRMLVLLHTPAMGRSDEEWRQIKGAVRSVIVMRTRLDLVVAVDSLRSGEGRQKFDPRKLPHFVVARSWKHLDAWFSHSFYVTRENWERFDLANIVETRHRWV